LAPRVMTWTKSGMYFLGVALEEIDGVLGSMPLELALSVRDAKMFVGRGRVEQGLSGEPHVAPSGVESQARRGWRRFARGQRLVKRRTRRKPG